MNECLINLTCPRCKTSRLNASQLRSHWCNGVSKTTGVGTLQPGRMLTSREYVDAITAARLLAESPNVLPVCDRQISTDGTAGEDARQHNPKETLTHE